MLRKMGHRMPLRHEIHQLILAGFREHGIDMPFPAVPDVRSQVSAVNKRGRTLTLGAGKTIRPAGSLQRA